MNKFSKKLKYYTVEELIKYIRYSYDYKPEVIDAVNRELELRGLKTKEADEKEFRRTNPVITLLAFGPRNILDRAAELITDENKEHLIVFCLNIGNQIIHSEVVSIGSLDTTLAHPREIFKPAIIHSAYAIVILHNHPSSIPEPSENDDSVTEMIYESGKILGIPLLDHIIIGTTTFYSYLSNDNILEQSPASIEIQRENIILNLKKII